MHLVGYGPITRAAVETLMADPEAEVFLRRVFANPKDGGLVAMESRASAFPSSLRRLLFLRDGETCRTLWCDAQVRHADHVTPRHRNGATDLDQGQGLCEACNYAKEAARLGAPDEIPVAGATSDRSRHTHRTPLPLESTDGSDSATPPTRPGAHRLTEPSLQVNHVRVVVGQCSIADDR